MRRAYDYLIGNVSHQIRSFCACDSCGHLCSNAHVPFDHIFCERDAFDFGVKGLQDFAPKLHIDLVGDWVAGPDEVPDVALTHQVFGPLDQSETHQSAPVIVLVRHFPDADHRCSLGNGASIQLEELLIELVLFSVAEYPHKVIQLAAESRSHHVTI